MTPDQQAAVAEWNRARVMREQWEAYELHCRRQVVGQLWGSYGDGTRSVEFAGGYVLKNVNTTRHDIADTADMRALVQKFCDFASTADVGSKLLTWKPRLSTRAYKALPAWGKPLIDKFVTATPQLPQLTLTAPRG